MHLRVIASDRRKRSNLFNSQEIASSSLKSAPPRNDTNSNINEKKYLKGKKVLITCGPTWVPIDRVRVISNRSTGEMGHLIAKDLKRSGAQITLIEGPVTHAADLRSISVIKFQFYDELVKILQEQLRKKYDIIIQAAAVSDYRLKNPYIQKISSHQREIHLQLIPTEKVIQRIKRLNPKAFLVGFKLEVDADLKKLKQKAAVLFKTANCDLVVANSFRDQRYQGYILDKQKNILFAGKNRSDLSQGLVKILCPQK